VPAALGGIDIVINATLNTIDISFFTTPPPRLSIFHINPLSNQAVASVCAKANAAYALLILPLQALNAMSILFIIGNQKQKESDKKGV
jgi:hypothetical protein